jgi:hypothetical protein
LGAWKQYGSGSVFVGRFAVALKVADGERVQPHAAEYREPSGLSRAVTRAVGVGGRIGDAFRVYARSSD